MNNTDLNEVKLEDYFTSPNTFTFHNNAEFADFQERMAGILPCERIHHDTIPVFDSDTIVLRFLLNEKEIVASSDNGDDSTAELKAVNVINDSSDYTETNTKKVVVPYVITNNLALLFKGYKKVVIEGGRSKANGKYNIRPRIILKDDNTFKLASDDSIFNIAGTTDEPIDVTISDLDFHIEGYKSISDIFKETVLFKIHQASSVKIFNCDFFSAEISMTNVFMRWCENVDVRNCNFYNYNCNKTSGCLWLWETANNVNIINNDFHKFGNDEAIALWASGTVDRKESQLIGTDFINTEDYSSRDVTFENIIVQGNRLYYENVYTNENGDTVTYPKNDDGDKKEKDERER